MSGATWGIVESSLPAWSYTYGFGGGEARSLAVAVEGGVVVVSPPSRPSEAVFEGLAALGALRGIVAPNAFHTLGVAPWRARFPEVPVFAPTQAIARVQKQSGVRAIRPVAELSSMLGERVQIVDMPHYRTGEILVRWRVEGGWAWYLTDVILNLKTPPGGVFGAVFRVTKSAPGLRRNAVAGTFMVRSRRALYGWLIEQAEQTPPRLIVPCHGEVVRPEDPVGEISAAVR